MFGETIFEAVLAHWLKTYGTRETCVDVDKV
jgi:hypothetical protein